MSTKNRSFTLLTEFEVLAGIKTIRDPMPTEVGSRHYRAIAQMVETALLRKLNGGVVPGLYERCSEPTSLYRPIVLRLVRGSVAFTLVLNLRTTQLELWLAGEFEFPGAFRQLLGFEEMNRAPGDVDQLPCPHCGRLIHVGD